MGERFLIFGGAGLVGAQCARQIARELGPSEIMIASLFQREVRLLVKELKREFPRISFKGEWGNLFVRGDYAHQERDWILQSTDRLGRLFDDVFKSRQEAYRRSHLVGMIRSYRPDVIIDCVNTATGLSYQDIYTNSLEVDAILKRMLADYSGDQVIEGVTKQDLKKLATLLVSEPIPQLVRHVVMLHDAMRESGTRLYLKVGTTGTGGMGLNIPYTHGEDKPSAKLMSKTAIAFAHTGLLFLLARTPGGPTVKEIKPGAMIGYRRVDYGAIRRGGHVLSEYEAKPTRLGAQPLPLHIPERNFRRKGDLKMVYVDTGENGQFTRGEFEAITSLGQMEFVTPEEIAHLVVLEVTGSNTGKDVIAAISGAILDPSYRAGYLRPQVLVELNWLEKRTKSASVALGALGPPELSKLLWEAHLLRERYTTLQKVVDAPASSISKALTVSLRRRPIRHTIVSTGVPILLPDGKTLLRGPKINIPEYKGEPAVALDADGIEQCAAKGWIDLRPENFERWQERFRAMLRGQTLSRGRGSAAIGLDTYLFEKIRIGAVAAWILFTESKGYRLK
jgi:hypothetical protein